MQKYAPLPAPAHTHPGSDALCTIQHQHIGLLPPSATALGRQAVHGNAASPEDFSGLSDFHRMQAEQDTLEDHQRQLKLWATALVHEAERLDREHETVRRWRHPIAESFARFTRCF